MKTAIVVIKIVTSVKLQLKLLVPSSRWALISVLGVNLMLVGINYSINYYRWLKIHYKVLWDSVVHIFDYYYSY